MIILHFSSLHLGVNFTRGDKLIEKWTSSTRCNESMSETTNSVISISCEEEWCDKICESEEDLYHHMKSHSSSKLKSTADITRDLFLKQKQILIATTKTTENTLATSFDVNAFNDNFPYGWARHIRKVSRFSKDQKQFVKNIYDEGELTGIKRTCDAIALLMRTHKENGVLVFLPVDYLNPSQIKGLIQRFINEGKPKPKKRRLENDMDIDIENVSSLYEDLVCLMPDD